MLLHLLYKIFAQMITILDFVFDAYIIHLFLSLLRKNLLSNYRKT